MNTESTDQAHHRNGTKAPQAALSALSRDEVMSRPAAERLAWFSSLTFQHRRLEVINSYLGEVMDPNNDIKIIGLIGPTGIGKTTLLDSCLAQTVQHYAPSRKPHEVPVAMVAAPANGERSFSWRVMYRRLTEACGTVLPDKQRASTIKNGEVFALRMDRIGLAQRRELLEAEVRNRNVRLLGIDEAHHLMRFGHSEAMMDTLKSLADIQHGTKLMLVGTYQIASLFSAYGQLARRSAILHYRRYQISSRPNDASPTRDEQEFRMILKKIAAHWPCEQVPRLEEEWQALMRMSLGCVGLLKAQLQQLASLQSKRKGETFNSNDMFRAFKASKMMNQMEREIVEGEEEVAGLCYGDADPASVVGGAEWIKNLEPVHA